MNYSALKTVETLWLVRSSYLSLKESKLRALPIMSLITRDDFL